MPTSSAPAVTAEQMREVDRLAVEELGLLLIQMMENAGARMAALVTGRFRPGTVVVLCGRGGNGGGGLVAARHLANHGVRVHVRSRRIRVGSARCRGTSFRSWSTWMCRSARSPSRPTSCWTR